MPVTDEEALLIALLMVGPQTWVHRRVEHVTFLDDRSVRRRVSIDFTVPAAWPGESKLHLPIAQFSKEPLIRFDFQDEAGAPVPMLTAQQNGAITTTVLRRLARVPDQHVDSIVDDYIERLVFATCDEDRAEALHKIFQPGTTVGATLGGFTPFRTLALDVAANFVVYVPITPGEQGKRRVVKLAYDRAEELTPPRRVREWLGFTPVQHAFLVPAAGLTESYHVEISPPTDLRFTSAVFYGFKSGVLVPQVAHEVATPRIHLNTSGLDRRFGFVHVWARAHSSVLTSSALFATISAAVLWFVLARLGEIAASANADAIVGVLVALPGVALAYILRPTEHAVASTYLMGYRALALVAAMASFAAAIILFAGYEEDQIYRAIRFLVAMATLAAVGLLGSWTARLSSSRGER